MADDDTKALELRGSGEVAIGGTAFPGGAEMQHYMNAASWIGRSGVYPQFKSAESAFVGMMMCRDLGLSLTMGLPLIYPVEGKLFVEVKGRLAALMTRVPSFEWEPLEWTEKVCRIRARLSQKHAWKEFEYTRAQADCAGFTKDRVGGVKKNWQGDNGREMLLWRCLTRWINYNAPHVLYGMPTRALEMDEAEELPGAVASEAAAGHTDEARKDGAPAATSEPDYRAAFATLARKMGKRTNAQFLGLLTLVFKELGLTPPGNYNAVAQQDWQRGYVYLTSKYDEDGQPRPAPREVESEDVTPQVEPEPEPEVSAEPEPTPAVPEVIIPEPEPDPVPELIPAVDYDTLSNGTANGLITLCGIAEKLYRKRGDFPRKFTSHDDKSGTWFVEGDCLMRCGSTKAGAPLATLITIEPTAEKKYEKLLAQDGLRAMLARAVREMIEDLEVQR